jgi:AraC-like DNA-binding protein
VKDSLESSTVRLDAVASSLCKLFDYVPELQFWVKDRQGHYRWVNRGFLLNYSLERPEDVVGRTDYDLSPQHLADQFRLDDDMVLQGHPVLGRVELVGRFDHTACWSVTNKLPLMDDKGRVFATAGVTCPLKGKEYEETYPDLVTGKIIGFIRRNFAKPLPNDELARIAGLSVRALERKFEQCFQMSPQRYVRRVRVRMACYALVHTRQPLAEIASSHGFCDQSHFSREFRRQVGMAPQEYRTRYQVQGR